MKGHIRQRSKGSWTIVIDVGRNPETGKRRQRWHTIRGTKGDAERALREMLYTVEIGSYVKSSRMTLGQWLNDWLAGYVEVNCSPRTKASYEMIARRHIIPELGMIPLRELESRHLQAFYSRHRANGRVDGKGPLSTRTIRYCHTLLAQALAYAVKMSLLARNVAKATDPPHLERKTMTTLTAKDVPKLLQAASDTPYYALFATLVFTGMRRGEALALRWRNLDLDLACLSVVETAYKLNRQYLVKEPKTPCSRRQIALTPSLAILLRQHRAKREAECLLLGKELIGGDHVFAHADGTPLDPSTVTHAFDKVIRKAGLPRVRLHDLRHTHASLMLTAGVHPKVVAERLGHSSVRITLDTYSHVLPGLQEAAAKRFDHFVLGAGQTADVCKMFASDPDLNVGVAGFEPATT